MGIAVAIISIVIGIPLSFLPTIIAIVKKHDKLLKIFLVNILLGWTFIGWIVALIWSLRYQEENTTE